MPITVARHATIEFFSGGTLHAATPGPPDPGPETAAERSLTARPPSREGPGPQPPAAPTPDPLSEILH